MSRFRHELPRQAGGEHFASAGMEIGLIFDHGIEIRVSPSMRSCGNCHGSTFSEVAAVRASAT